jgi:hypothetical protein
MCNWSHEAGSLFRLPQWQQDSLYFENEVTAALDAETGNVGRRRGHRVAEPQA